MYFVAQLVLSCDMLLTWKRIQSQGISKMIHLTKEPFIFNGGGGGNWWDSTGHSCYMLTPPNWVCYFFYYETFHLVCFYVFLYFSGIELPFVHNRVDPGACFPRKIWTFWMWETLVFGILGGCLHYYKCRHCKILINFFGDPPFKPTMFFLTHPPPPPFKAIFFFMIPPLKKKQ